MKAFLFPLFLIFTSLCYNPSKAREKEWEPVEDIPFLQEAGEKIESPKPVTAVKASPLGVFAISDGSIYKVEHSKLKKSEGAPEKAYKLFSEKGRIWAGAKEGLFEYRKGEWVKIDDRAYVDMSVHLGTICAVTTDALYKLEGDRFVSLEPEGGYQNSSITNTMEDGSQIFISPIKLNHLSQIASYSGTIYLMENQQLVAFDGQKLDKDFIDWGTLNYAEVNDMIAMGSRLLIGTRKGLQVLRGASLIPIRGRDGLPVEATTTLSLGFDYDLWIGTERGAVRMTKEGDFQYFSSGMWLPDGKVNDIAVASKTVFVATDRGLGLIHYYPTTLEEKAGWMQHYIESFGYQRLGFIHYLYKKDGEWIREITDNDGSHTAIYLAALCYEYAVTKDEKVREKAVEAFKSLVWLQKITGTEGFVARSIWSPADGDPRSTGGSGGLPARWYQTPDGKWFWKGDTSSDEVTSHFYAVSIFYDLVAKGKEKQMAGDHLKKLASYIIDCGWTMHDMDGKPTRWARWDPEYLLRPYGYMDRGLNGLEALSFMRSAFTLTGDKKFEKGYEQLMKWGYPENTIRQKNTFPPTDIAPWDDDLAFMSYNTLLRYEKDSKMRSIYLRSLERTWEVKRVERHPWFNFTYSVLTGNEGEVKEAVNFLREWQLSGVEEHYSNSHRDDLFLEKGYRSYDGTVKILSPREKYIGLDGANSLELDGFGQGKRAQPPVDFLRCYWMGRYYGLISEPQQKTAPLPPDLIKEKGAEPYKGNPRPEID